MNPSQQYHPHHHDELAHPPEELEEVVTVRVVAHHGSTVGLLSTLHVAL
jgi:hypothetical protein